MRSVIISTLAIAALSLIGVGGAGCQDIHLGRGTLNDYPPNAPDIAHGSFTSLNGQTVTGTAIIYDLGGGNYTVFLNGVSVPSESGLEVVAKADIGTVATITMKAFSGNQRYDISVSGSPTFTQVNIYSPRTTRDYGQALLQ